MSSDPQQPDIDGESTAADTDGSANASSNEAVPWREDQLREARRRALIWGVGGGLIMSLLLVGACILLILAADA